MIGVVIPAYNEEQSLQACLDAVQHAIRQIQILKLEVKVLVVLDGCKDRSLNIVQASGVEYLECDVHCVGKARDLGTRQMIEMGADWIACTDADSCVDSQWLFEQLKVQPVDAICGVVELDHGQYLSEYAKEKYQSLYQDRMGHSHIHGANLSFSRESYMQTGGFEARKCHEDVDLVKRMQQLKLDVLFTNLVRVTTSSRLDARAPEGFASFLRQLEQDLDSEQTSQSIHYQ